MLIDQDVKRAAGGGGRHDLYSDAGTHYFGQYGDIRKHLAIARAEQQNFGLKIQCQREIVYAQCVHGGWIPVRDNSCPRNNSVVGQCLFLQVYGTRLTGSDLVFVGGVG